MLRPLRIVLQLLTACSVTAAHAATMNFSDMPIGPLSVPGSYQSGGVGFQLNGSGSAVIEDLGETPLLIYSGTEFALEIPEGTTMARLTLFQQGIETYLTINGESALLPTLHGQSGFLGGVAYQTMNGLMPIELNGPLTSLTITTPAPPFQGYVWIIEVTLVPEPSTCALAILGAAALLAFRRR
jgi:hypothetical protein